MSITIKVCGASPGVLTGLACRARVEAVDLGAAPSTLVG
jgi:hypothetical protein